MIPRTLEVLGVERGDGVGGRPARHVSERRASFVLWWTAVSMLAAVVAWLLFSSSASHPLAISGDLLGRDAALAAICGFLVGAVQAGMLTAHGVVGERAATRHWIGTTLAWIVLWPAQLVAPIAIAGDGRTVTLLWHALPWLMLGALSLGWLLVPLLRTSHSPPNGGGRMRLLAGHGQLDAASGEALYAIQVRRKAVAASDRSEAA